MSKTFLGTILAAMFLMLVCSGANADIFKTKSARDIVNKTAAYTVTKEDYERIITNAGATGAVTFTLPDAGTVIGREYKFVDMVDQNIYIDPQVDEYIYAAGLPALAAGDKIRCGKKGCAVNLVAVTNGVWVVDESIYGVGMTDAWTDAN
jgi:hypothetical protein